MNDPHRHADDGDIVVQNAKCGVVRIAPHAVDRFLERWTAGDDREAARSTLVAVVGEAVPLREKTFRGHEMWAAFHVRLVVKRDRKIGPIVVTVLPEPDPNRYEQSLKEIDAWRAQAEPISVTPASVEWVPPPSPTPPPIIGSSERAQALLEAAQRAHREAYSDIAFAHDLHAFAEALASDAKKRVRRAVEAMNRTARGGT